jgi:hypothetical protein
MKKVLSAALISFVLLGAGNLRAADLYYSGNYAGAMAGSMMGAMWDFMEWFLGRRYGRWNTPYGYSNWGSPVSPYRYRDYWDEPNPWVEMQPLDGTWLAQSGEYWYVRGNRFVLLDSRGNRSSGEFRMEGEFILTRMPWGEVEFQYRQMGDVLILRDVNGRLMLLRRIEAGGWNW